MHTRARGSTLALTSAWTRGAILQRAGRAKYVPIQRELSCGVRSEMTVCDTREPCALTCDEWQARRWRLYGERW